MKKLFVVILMVIIMTGCVSVPMKSNNSKIYTAYNIWVHPCMKCINYKNGNFIPVGTELKYVKIKQLNKTTSAVIINNKLIEIELHDGKKHKIIFNHRWHTNKKMKDYVRYLSTERTFDELTLNMSEIEVTAIKQGKIVVGMSKEAVLLSYGMPPEHRTPDLKSNRWVYWMNKRKQKAIYFYNNRAVTRAEYNKLTSENVIKNTKEL